MATSVLLGRLVRREPQDPRVRKARPVFPSLWKMDRREKMVPLDPQARLVLPVPRVLPDLPDLRGQTVRVVGATTAGA